MLRRSWGRSLHSSWSVRLVSSPAVGHEIVEGVVVGQRGRVVGGRVLLLHGEWIVARRLAHVAVTPGLRLRAQLVMDRWILYSTVHDKHDSFTLLHNSHWACNGCTELCSAWQDLRLPSQPQNAAC